MKRNGTNWFLPFTEIELFHTKTDKETAVSRALSGIIQKHEHNWQLGHGAGNWITCALGKANQLMFAVEREDFARLIKIVCDNVDPEHARKFVEACFDHDTSWRLQRASRQLPESGFKDHESFRKWIAEQLEYEIEEGPVAKVLKPLAAVPR